jgi:hypothetical protein
MQHDQIVIPLNALRELAGQAESHPELSLSVNHLYISRIAHSLDHRPPLAHQLLRRLVGLSKESSIGS